MNTFFKINLVLLVLIFTSCSVSDIKTDIKSKIKSKINIDRTAPIIKLLSAKETKLKTLTRSFILNSNENGEVIYEKGCKGDLKNVSVGNNTLTFSLLQNGYYDFCRVSIVDNSGNYSKSIKIPSFQIGDNKTTIYEINAIANVTVDRTPSYTFRSSFSGIIEYKGSCKSRDEKASKGNNVITFSLLSKGLYNDCYIKVIGDNTASNLLHVSPFKVDNREFELLDEPIVTRLATLDSDISESSGMIVIDGRIYTHNDSGGEAKIIEIDSFGRVVRKINIENALNVDWEAMTQDDKYIYIADIGNNNGKREDLAIYKISKRDISFKDTLKCEVINIKYSEQEIFKYSALATPFDAEAILSYRDKLYIFTKNWKNKTTSLYSVDKKAGSYELSTIQEHKFDFLITDATYHKYTDTIVLIGYNSMFMTHQKIVLLQDFEDANFFSGEIKEFNILNPPYGFKQIEAVSFKDDNSLYITSENISNRHLGNHIASLFEVKLF
jgi:hypothetical protein